MSLAEPISDLETARLAALRQYAVLDSVAEQAYDDVVLLASHICRTPIALISLIDESRQWFKARVGLGVSETARELAFCDHAIRSPGEVMVVRDATRDERFAHNALVQGDPNIRFYAGAPLVTPKGVAIGTVCVIDRQARDLSSEESQALQALARQVVAQFELRSALAEQKRQAEELATYQSRLEDYQFQIESANSELRRQSTTDALTGLKNRREFEERLDGERHRSVRHGEALSVLLVDVDEFKSFNDEFGHAVGDQVLRMVADALSRNLRGADMVCRFGGEEFAVLLPHTDHAGAVVMAERCRRAIESMRCESRRITASVGVATLSVGQESVELLAQADTALYAAKDQGRNRVAW